MPIWRDSHIVNRCGASTKESICNGPDFIEFGQEKSNIGEWSLTMTMDRPDHAADERCVANLPPHLISPKSHKDQ